MPSAPASGVTLEAAARCELFAWRVTPEERLAEVLVLDQFSRNVYRDSPRAFAQDALALAVAQELVERFGRYPHRNAILGRESTPEELAFLSELGSGF